MNTNEGVQTKSKTKNLTSSCCLAFQSKIETYSLPNSYSEIIGRTDQMRLEIAYDKEIKKLIDIAKMKVRKKPKNALVTLILELFHRKEDGLTRKIFLNVDLSQEVIWRRV